MTNVFTQRVSSMRVFTVECGIISGVFYYFVMVWERGKVEKVFDIFMDREEAIIFLLEQTKREIETNPY